MFGKWLNRVLNSIPSIKRWQGEITINQHLDNSTHMWSVAVIADGLARWEIEKFNNEVDVLTLLRKAIYHDVIECESGDIRSTFKRKTPEIKRAIENVEEIVFRENVEQLLPHNWREEYRNYLLNPKDNKKTIEGRLLAAADNISALNECIQEVKCGNSSFIPFLQQVANELLEVDLDSSRYFIKHCLVDFGLPLECYGKTIIDFINDKK